MIEDLIQAGQYQEALTYLNDLDDEQVRYLRLVCLYGLQELKQAQVEAMKAKALATNTYYDVVAIYVSILKDLEEYEEAINIIVEELSMPYIPYQYETVFNTAYDELLLAKQEANQGMGIKNTSFSEEEIENLLTKDDTHEDLLYMAIEQLEAMNIRRMLPAIRQFLKNNDKPDFAKSLLVEIMIDQEIDEDMELVKNHISYQINPSFAPHVLGQEASYTISELLSQVLEDENPSLFQLCLQFLDFYLYQVYPQYIDEEDYRAIAGAIHYHLALLQYIDVEIDDIEFAYNCDKEDVYRILKVIQGIEY